MANRETRALAAGRNGERGTGNEDVRSCKGTAYSVARSLVAHVEMSVLETLDQSAR